MGVSRSLILSFSVACLFGLTAKISIAGPISVAPYVSGYHKDVSPALELLIEQNIAQRKYKETLDLLDADLKKDPKNLALMYKKVEIYTDIEQYNKAIDILNQISKIRPNDPETVKLRTEIDKEKQAEPHNELGFDEDIAYASDLHSYWQYSSLYYYRYTDLGNFGGRVNYAKRYGTTGEQYQLEAYPKLFSGAYAAINLAYANSTQILYPSFQYGVEAYFDVSHGIEFSLGQATKKFVRFSNQKIYTYTGSLGKYMGNYFLWFRPSYFQPKATWYYEVGVRREFDNPHSYLTVKVAAGRLPDIGDLPPFDQMVLVSQQGLNIAGEFPLMKKLFLKLGVGYTHQIFHPSETVRNITDGSVGLDCIF